MSEQVLENRWITPEVVAVVVREGGDHVGRGHEVPLCPGRQGHRGCFYLFGEGLWAGCCSCPGRYSTPVECVRSRETVNRSDLADWANYGYCRSHSRFYWGLKLHLVCTPTGLPVRPGINRTAGPCSPVLGAMPGDRKGIDEQPGVGKVVVLSAPALSGRAWFPGVSSSRAGCSPSWSSPRASAVAVTAYTCIYVAPRQGGDDRLLARDESKEARLCDTGTLGDRLGRGAVVALERELGDRGAGMTLSRLSCLLIQPVPPCWRAPVGSA